MCRTTWVHPTPRPVRVDQVDRRSDLVKAAPCVHCLVADFLGVGGSCFPLPTLSSDPLLLETFR